MTAIIELIGPAGRIAVYKDTPEEIHYRSLGYKDAVVSIKDNDTHKRDWAKSSSSKDSTSEPSNI